MTIVLWMAYAALCAGAFAAIGAQLEQLAARHGRARRLVWALLIGASVAMPIAVGARPIAVSTPVAGDAAAPAATSPGSRRAPHASADMIILSSWAALSVLFGTLMLGAHWRTSRAMRRCRGAVVAGRDALLSEDFGPALVGIVRPRIVLPLWTLALTQTERELVVTHEAEHRDARDPLLLLSALLALVAMPWNAGLWLQFLRLRAAIELDCDARVVRRHRHDPIAYGMLLLDVRERARGVPRPMLAFLRTESSLMRRVRALALPRAAARREAFTASALALCLAAGVAFVPAPSVRVVAAELARTRATAVAPGPDAMTKRRQTAVGTVPPAGNSVYTFTAREVGGSPAPATHLRVATSPARRVSRSMPALSTADLPPARVAEVVLSEIGKPTAAALPISRRGGAMLRAVPNGGGRGGRGGAAFSQFGISPPPAGTVTPVNVIRAVGRPDTLSQRP